MRDCERGFRSGMLTGATLTAGGGPDLISAYEGQTALMTVDRAPKRAGPHRALTAAAAVFVGALVALALALATIAAAAIALLLAVGALTARLFPRRAAGRAPDGWTLESAPRPN